MSPELIQLRDPQTGATASVLAGFGFNCYSYRPRHEGRAVELLWSDPQFASGEERPSRSGIPLLFPFAGRIEKGSYTFEGRDYRLTSPLAAMDAGGNAIHGFVFNRPWEVIEQTGARVVGRFQASRVEPAILDVWPADFILTVSYELAGNTLASVLSVENPGPGRLPFGLGTHGYLRPPVERPEDLAGVQVRVPLGESWELVDLLPIGRRTTGPLERELSAGMPHERTQLDSVFGNLRFQDGWCTASLADPASGLATVLRWDEAFPYCVLYNPPHRQAFCIEPYTTVPDPFRLTAAGIDAGMRVLRPGESFTGRVDLSLESL